MVSTAPALALSKTASKMPAPSPRVSLILSTWVSYITEIRLKSADFGLETRRSCLRPIQEGVSETGDQGCLIGPGSKKNRVKNHTGPYGTIEFKPMRSPKSP